MPTTIYCVQAYWMDRRKLAMGALRQFKSETQAREVARDVAKRTAGAIVYRVSGEPEFDYWGEPAVIEELGQVPDVRD